MADNIVELRPRTAITWSSRPEDAYPTVGYCLSCGYRWYYASVLKPIELRKLELEHIKWSTKCRIEESKPHETVCGEQVREQWRSEDRDSYAGGRWPSGHPRLDR